MLTPLAQPSRAMQMNSPAGPLKQVAIITKAAPADIRETVKDVGNSRRRVEKSLKGKA